MTESDSGSIGACRQYKATCRFSRQNIRTLARCHGQNFCGCSSGTAAATASEGRARPFARQAPPAGTFYDFYGPRFTSLCKRPPSNKQISGGRGQYGARHDTQSTSHKAKRFQLSPRGKEMGLQRGEREKMQSDKEMGAEKHAFPVTLHCNDSFKGV